MDANTGTVVFGIVAVLIALFILDKMKVVETTDG
jgi:hypothetical protein